jgi:hypothetical protein
MDNIEAQMQNVLTANPNYRVASPNTVINIPVVVHVVWNTAAQNISDLLVKSQIDALNEDYNGTNADVVKVPRYFKNLVGSAQFHFVLAQRDPSGNPTNGVIRKYTTNSTGFTTNDYVKYNIHAGDNAWPCANYMNIWVCNFDPSSGLLGYAQFPGGNCATDGVVIQYDAFGRISTYTPYTLARTTSHEFGHCFNLRHIWGDDGTACSGSDQVSDTPNSAGPHFGCPCQTITCSNGPNGDMYQNFMDYSDDNCMFMLTNGQAARMNSCITTYRSGLNTSLGATPVTTYADDVEITSIINPIGSPCLTSTNMLTPQIVITNLGSNSESNIPVNYKVDNGALQTYTYVGPLAAGASATFSLNAINATAAFHIFSCYTAVAGDTINKYNNYMTSSFIGKNASISLPVNATFDANPFPPTSWSKRNLDGDVSNGGTCSPSGPGWVRTTAAHYAGAASAELSNFTETLTTYDDLTTAPLDLTTVPNPTLTFWRAYTSKSNSISDSLEILISTDCGVNFTSIYKNWGASLMTAPIQSTAFTPTSTQWSQDLVDLTPYNTSNNAIIVFRDITNKQNNLYVDEVYIDQAVRVNNVANLSSLNIYPNPSNGTIYIAAKFSDKENLSISVSDLLGRKVYNKEINSADFITIPVDLSSRANGVYIVSIRTPSGVINRKITLNQ